MKKLAVLLLTLTLLFTMAACDGSNAEDDAGGDAGTNAGSDAGTDADMDAGAETWTPTRDVECIVPFAPGGGSDLLTRKIIEYANIQVNLVPVNVEGGSGLVGAEQAAAEPADGYTILAHNPMNLISQGLTKTSDVWEHLTPLAFVVDDWTTLYTSKETGWNSMEDFVAYAEAHPGEVKWGFVSAPVTTADSYRILEELAIDCTMVPYDGGAECNAALMGNHIQILLNTASDSAGYVDSGDFLPLGTIGTTRCPSLPDTPTMLELGLSVDTGAPRAYFAPAGCSDEIIAYYDDLLKNICENEAFVTDLAVMGFTVSYTGAVEGRELMQKWYDSLLPVFQKYGLTG